MTQSTTRYSNRRSSSSGTTIVIPTETAVKVGDKCLILAKSYIAWDAPHKYPDRDFTWMNQIFTVREIKSTVAVIVSGDIRKQVPIDSIRVISSDTIESIRNPPKVEAIDQALPPICITDLLNLSSGSEIAQKSAIATEDDQILINLCKWLLSSPKLPTTPFEFHPGVIARDGYLDALKRESQQTIDWAEGERSSKHPRHVCGALERDLVRLQELAG